MQKTEESLRRLKKIRDKSTGILPSEPQGTSDDEKIRIQLKVDVNGYVNMVEKLQVYLYLHLYRSYCHTLITCILQIGDLNISTANIRYLQELQDAVEAAIKK